MLQKRGIKNNDQESKSYYTAEVGNAHMCPACARGATLKYWKPSLQRAVQRALRRPAQLRNSDGYWNELLTGAG